MNHAWQIGLLLAASYLIGTIPIGLIISRLRGVDIRRQGSGNYGATNVGRVLGRKWGALVLVLDVAKGAVTSLGAGYVLRALGGEFSDGSSIKHDLVWLGTGICCVLGNTAPIYLGFKGGKGVATALGVILGMWPYLTGPALVALVVWALVVLSTGYVSLGSIVAASTLPISFLAMARLWDWGVSEHSPLLALSVLLPVIIVIRHRSNIGRLLAGIENKAGRGES